MSPRQPAETFINELGRKISLVAWISAGDLVTVTYTLHGPSSQTVQNMTPMEAEKLIHHLRAALDGKDDRRVIVWLIERKFHADWQQQETRWYAENSTGWHWWTEVAHEAKRFASKAEAEAYPAYRMIRNDQAVSLTEHVFMERVSRPAHLSKEG